MREREQAPSQSYFWPVIWAVALHALMFAMLFVSFAFTPELPPARPVVQATLYQLQSQSQATTQTNQKIAGEATKTAAPQFEVEQLEQKKADDQKIAAAKAAEQKKVEAARKAEAVKKAEAEKKATEQKRQADIAKKKAADEAAKKKAEEEAKKKAAAEAAKKAAEDAKKKAAAEAAQRKAVEDKKAAALAELMAASVEYEQTKADTYGDQVAGSLDDLFKRLVQENWILPPSARRGMSVDIRVEMLPDGTITNASVTRSSGDRSFDNSAVAALRNIGRIPEMQQLDRATFDRLYRQRTLIFKPENFGL